MNQSNQILISVVCTVYNNVWSVKGAIETLSKSINDLPHEFVIVDNYSTDGTFEVLKELCGEYPIKLYREHCTRGLGWNIAFKKSSGKYILYVTLDALYNVRLLSLAIKGYLKWKYRDLKSLVGFGAQIHPRWILEKISGWRDLNYSEDIDLVSRLHRFNLVAYLPISDSRYDPFPHDLKLREKRYARGLKLFTRLINNYVDKWIGQAYSLKKLVLLQKFKLRNQGVFRYFYSIFLKIIGGIVISILAKLKVILKGINVFHADEILTNYHYVYYMNLKRAVNPLEFGYNKKDISIKIIEDIDYIYLFRNDVKDLILKILSWKRSVSC